ncbi:hypothetical protein Scep_025668 [Stephania cephalantha]|uniref:Uncharacterized protein n=1 Tax=Stephania cephalantha TaxID=152367 RepID=A0AAP0HPK4_9MAGN
MRERRERFRLFGVSVVLAFSKNERERERDREIDKSIQISTGGSNGRSIDR